MGGMKHFIRFVNNMENGVTEVKIEEAVENFIKEKNVEKPVVIIDLAQIGMHIFKHDYEKIFGGCYEVFNERTDTFFKSLVDLGLELVTVLDADLFVDKGDTFFEGQANRYSLETKLLQRVRKEYNFTIDHLNTEDFLLPFIHNLKLIAKDYSELIVTTRKCDQEIAYQANTRNALAIMTHNQNFLIYDGTWEYWSSVDYDMEKKTIKRLNRDEARKHLKLSPAQMIIFSAMIGNDFVRYKTVKRFLIRTCNGTSFPKVADYVRQCKSTPPDLSFKDETFITNTIFNRASDKKDGRERIKKTIQFFSEITEPVKYDTPLLEKAASSTFLYSILKDIPFLMPLQFIDLGEHDMKPYYHLVKPIICRQMGTIFKATNVDENAYRVIYAKLTPYDDYDHLNERGEFPKDTIPSLEDFILIPNNTSDPLYNLKLKLFCWQVLPDCANFTPDIIKNLPEEWVLTLATITFLVETNQIDQDEADAFLFASINDKNPLNLTKDSFKSLDYRNLRVTFIFTSVYCVIAQSCEVLGLTNLESEINFDGGYYHYLRQKDDERVELLKELKESHKHLRIYSC